MRAKALALRAAVPDPVRAQLSLRLAEAGLTLALRHAPSAAAAVSAFLPIRDEPDTMPLLAALSAAGFATALPVTGGRGTPLRFQAWRTGEPLTAGVWGIREPASSAVVVDPDILFVPLAAFDRRGDRIGYGAGFYDGALARLRRDKAILAIGIAFAVQEVDRVPAEPHDEALDAVITERETILFTRS